MSRDPIAATGNVPGGLGGYAYVDNRPTFLLDPSGLCPVWRHVIRCYQAIQNAGSNYLAWATSSPANAAAAIVGNLTIAGGTIILTATTVFGAGCLLGTEGELGLTCAKIVLYGVGVGYGSISLGFALQKQKYDEWKNSQGRYGFKNASTVPSK